MSDHVSPTPARTLYQNAASKLEVVKCNCVCGGVHHYPLQ